MRISVRSPMNFSWVMNGSLETVCQADAGYGEQKAGDDTGSDIGGGAQPFPVFQHFRGFPAETGKGGVSAEESDSDGDAQVGRDEHAVQRKLPEEAQKQAAGQIDEQ